MSARIINLADFRRGGACHRSAEQSASVPQHGEFGSANRSAGNFPGSFQFWSGASGKRYVHSVYALEDCPDLPASTYVLVHRNGDGRCSARSVGRLMTDNGMSNRAEILRRAGKVGANEVHVHLLAQGRLEMKVVEQDVRTGQFTATHSSAGH
jgi:hypothetical protein